MLKFLVVKHTILYSYTKASPILGPAPDLLLMSYGTLSTLLLLARYGPMSTLTTLGTCPYSANIETWNRIHTQLVMRYGTSPTLTTLLGTYKYHKDNNYNLTCTYNSSSGLTRHQTLVWNILPYKHTLGLPRHRTLVRNLSYRHMQESQRPLAY